MLHLPICEEALPWVHIAPNLVGLFSFVFPFPFVTFFPLNNNALSKHGGREVSMFFILVISLHT